MTTAMAIERRPHSEPVPLGEIPHLSLGDFRATVIGEITAAGSRILALFGQPVDAGIRLYAVLGYADSGSVAVLTTDVGDRYRALTPECAQAHWFEREIAEQWGVVPEGHPWLKPIRFHHSYRPGHDAWGRTGNEPIMPGEVDYFQVEGAEIHEVAVGPVHAGVIEPGSFRFQCHGEDVFHLEISLGYQHRGIEKALVGGPDKRTVHLMEVIAGDTSIGHATAYCQAIEALAGCEPPLRAQALRAIASELERLANHVGDLGALANDVGYLPTASYCGRLRGDFLNTTADLCGSRFGRGLIRPGGVLWDVDRARAERMAARVEAALKDVAGATAILWDSPSVQARFEETGQVSPEQCEALGLVGLAARACGVDQEVRRDFPSGFYRFAFFPVASWHTGDVFGRAYVRWLEVQRSGEFVIRQLRSLAASAGPIKVQVGALRPETMAVSMGSGWRGRICHVAITDRDGRFARYKVYDPSFYNWIVLMMAMRNQQISDFPLCNKSFNLSYCGHDL
jgi:Ni,Fe-hydrogenase III large subunit